jgi:GNAT superfamily N-acetyltransferase
VEGLTAYDALLREASDRGAGNINCYMMPDDVEGFAREGRLFYTEMEAGLAIYVKYPYFYRLYLQIIPEKTPTIAALSLPVIAEFPGVGAQLAVKSLRAAAGLESVGFTQNAVTKRMSLIMEEPPPDSPSSPVVAAEEKHADSILALWEETFDPVVNFMPDKESLLRELADGNVLCVPDGEAGVSGVLQMQFVRGAGWIWHEAVSRKARGRGIGRLLSEAHLREGAKRGVLRHCLWVVEGSPLAAGFHCAIGFRFDGRFSVQYI